MNTPRNFQHRFCVAPMMEWTDRHCRYFLRQFSRHTLLYTEMVTSAALKYGDTERFLRFNPEEQPVALQLGGSDPQELAEAAALGEQAGYCEINLNCGCPSDRVQRGKIGACLMAEPELVAACVHTMQSAVTIPVTVKCRIGIDNLDSLEHLARFVGTVAAAGCRTFIIHARIAILTGLSPKENREIPPLDYARVFAIKQAFPELEIIINGGIRSLPQARELLDHVDGVMVGREAYQNPNILAAVDNALFDPGAAVITQEAALARYRDYVSRELSQGTALKHMTRHILGLFQGQPGAKQFRRYLSENAHLPNAGIEVLEHAGGFIRPPRTQATPDQTTTAQEVSC